ncbi:MAG: class I SAM-dependent methyltransferase [Bacteroidota bacterium]
MTIKLPPPLSTRRGIPFYHAKSEAEFKDDVYERYDSLVARQTALHLCDELHGGYPLQPLLDYVLAGISEVSRPLVTADLGCSVGRIAGELALRHPAWEVYGIDLSYQMLRQATEVWKQGSAPPPNLVSAGWGTPALPAHQLKNLHFALAKAEALPFPDGSLDLIVNTFLIDRVPDPFAAFAEWHRCLKPGGRLIAVSPLNFLNADSWRKYHPPVKILNHLIASGWSLLDWVDPLTLEEPLDARGNAVKWQTVGMVLGKI